jgi:uncharacterized delta-60 repeat protein
MSVYYCESCLTNENILIDGGSLPVVIAGQPNVGFNVGVGFNNAVNAIGLQPDGKILVGGGFTSYSGVSRNYIIRLNTDGSVDNSFVIGTGFNLTSTVFTIQLQSDGKILVGGRFSSYSGVTSRGIIRLNTDGSVDTSFVIGTGFNSSSQINTIELQSDGKILVGGQFTTYSGVSINNIIRLNTDGSIDNSFVIGAGFDNGVFRIQLQSDGKILVGGQFTTYSGVSYNRLIRLNTNGSVDTSFVIGTGFDNAVRTIQLQSDGKILVGGSFTSYSGVSYNRLIRLNTNGSVDTSFVIGTGFDNFVSTIQLQTDGKILAGGNFTQYSGLYRNYIVRLNTDGSIDADFIIGDGFNGIVNTMQLQPDGKILVGGFFSIYNGYFTNYLCLINENIDSTILYTTDFKCYIPQKKVTPLYDFTSFSVGYGFNNTVSEIQLQPDGKIIVGGSFTSYSGVSGNRIIRLNTDGSVDTSFVIGAGINNSVLTIQLQPDGKILVGGIFSSYSGVTRNRIIRLNTDGSVDTSFVIGTGFNGDVRTIELQPDGKILVGGDFTSYSGVSRNRIIRLNTDGSVDTSFVIGAGINNSVLTIELQSDGKILAGGGFTSYSGVTRNRIIRLNTDGSVDTSFVIGTGFNGDVRTIQSQPDGKILVGGGFTSYSGVSRNYIIRLNTDGSVDTSFVIGIGFGGTVNTIELQPDGKILVGGDFTTYSGVSFSRIVKLNTDGSVDASFVIGTGFDNSVLTIQLQSDSKILVGGTFSIFDNYLTPKIARITETPAVPQYEALLLFVDCEVCNGYVIPISANTEYEVCEVCSGNTFTVEAPHPVWTGMNGGAVTQLDAIVLGGPNGLNN